MLRLQERCKDVCGSGSQKSFHANVSHTRKIKLVPEPEKHSAVQEASDQSRVVSRRLRQTSEPHVSESKSSEDTASQRVSCSAHRNGKAREESSGKEDTKITYKF